MTSGEQTDHFQTTAERDPNDYGKVSGKIRVGVCVLSMFLYF